MTQPHFIQNLLQVKDPNIQFQNKSDEVMKNNRQAVLFYGNLDKFPEVFQPRSYLENLPRYDSGIVTS